MTHNSRRLDCLSSRLNLGLLKSYFIWHILLVLLFIGSNFLIVLSEQQFNVFPFAIDKSQIWREQPLVQDFIMTYICLNLIKTTWVINKVYYFNIKQCIGNWLKRVPSTSMILFNVCVPDTCLTQVHLYHFVWFLIHSDQIKIEWQFLTWQ